jgi:hypothetical protein
MSPNIRNMQIPRQIPRQIILRLMAPLALGALLLPAPHAARAGNCANPTRPEGATIYNQAYHVPQYCNGTDWIAWAPVGATPGPQMIFLTAGSTWTVPSDWNASDNSIEVIGGGGGGFTDTAGSGGGGGGGAYAKITNLALTPGATIAIQIGSGGTGAAGGDTYFNDLDGSGTTCDSSGTTGQSVCAKGGSAGTTTGGGAGGSSASSVGTASSGGNGGGDGADWGGGGGGGAAGPNGTGKNGASGPSSGSYCAGGGGGGADNGSAGSTPSTRSGGNGGNGRSGAGGGVGDLDAGADGTVGGGGAGGASAASGCGSGDAFPGGNGGADSEWDATHGTGGGGGGGGGADSGDGGNGGNGGLYGGGGAGNAANFFGGGTDGVAGSGAAGLIVVKYTPSSSCPSNGLLANWKLDELSGSSAAPDASGNGNNGTLVNVATSTAWQAGKVNNALALDGVNDKVTFTDINGTDNASQMTIAAWVKASTLGDSQILLSKFNGTNNWVFGTSSGCGGQDDMEFYADASGGTYSCTTGNFHQTGVWEHWAVVYDGTQTGNANRVKIYYNGTSRSLTFNSTVPATTGSNSAAITLGQNPSGVLDSYFSGLADDIRIYNRPLSDGEISSLYNAGAGCQ